MECGPSTAVPSHLNRISVWCGYEMPLPAPSPPPPRARRCTTPPASLPPKYLGELGNIYEAVRQPSHTEKVWASSRYLGMGSPC